MTIAAAVVAMIACTVAGNLFLKTGASAQVDFLSKLMAWPVLLGVACFGTAAVVYVFILTRLPLNIAQSFLSAQFIAVILAARIFLAEPISAIQWSGVALITLGIVVIGWSQ